MRERWSNSEKSYEKRQLTGLLSFDTFFLFIQFFANYSFLEYYLPLTTSVL